MTLLSHTLINYKNTNIGIDINGN